MPTIRRLTSLTSNAIAGLAAILVDCVDGGASVSFMAPLDQQRAEAWWRGLDDDVETGRRIVLVAEDDAGMVGTVQLVSDLPENQPHRADVAKMLVMRRGRDQGVATALMRALEVEARAAGKTVLVLDTASAAAERVYQKCGWTLVGTVPDFALLPEGGLCETRFYFKRL